MLGCHWIQWERIDVMPDPTRIFSTLVICIMFARFLIKHNWDFGLLLSGFVLNPCVLFSVLTATMVWLWGPSPSRLPVFDRWAAEWYWWNGFFYHMIMDGFSGSLGLIPVVVDQYQMLDRRFITGHSVPWTVGMVELLVMGPMCFVVYLLIVKRHPLRFPLELILSSFQLMGMIVFLVSEVYEGQLNVPALDPVGHPGNAWANLRFNHYHITYYWFGFWFCNLVWGVVPYYRIVRAVAECHQRLKEHQD